MCFVQEDNYTPSKLNDYKIINVGNVFSKMIIIYTYNISIKKLVSKHN